MDKNKLLKTNDAAHYLGVSRSSLTNWIKQGLISGGVTPGGHYRFTIAELDEFAVRRGLTRSGGAAPSITVIRLRSSIKNCFPASSV